MQGGWHPSWVSRLVKVEGDLMSRLVLSLFVAAFASLLLACLPAPQDGDATDGGWANGECVDANNCRQPKCVSGHCRRCTSTDKHRRCAEDAQGSIVCKTCTVTDGCGTAQKITVSACIYTHECPAINQGSWVPDSSSSAINCDRTQCWNKALGKPTGC